MANKHSLDHCDVFEEVELPKDWIYRSPKLGPITLMPYASPETQMILVLIIYLLCQGALSSFITITSTSMPSDDSYIAALPICLAAFAVVTSGSGCAINMFGIKTILLSSSLGFCLSMAAYLCFIHNANSGYMVFAIVVFGSCTAVFVVAQVAFILSYASERSKGRWISSWLAVSYLCSVIKNLHWFWLSFGSSEVANVDGISVILLVFAILGTWLCWALIDMQNIIRRDGSVIILVQHPTWKKEIQGLWWVLRNETYILLLFPMFFASYWSHSYQSQMNGLLFSRNTRHINRVIFGIVQMFGAILVGCALDFAGVRRTTRGKLAWTMMFVLTFIIWPGDYTLDLKYHWQDQSYEISYDGNSNEYLGPLFLYLCYGFYDAAWQTCLYWLLGALSNNSRKLTHFVGFCAGVRWACSAYSERSDVLPDSTADLLVSSWVLCASSLVIALPVVFWKVKDTTPVEEDLIFSDQVFEVVLDGSRKIGLTDERR